MTEITSAVFRTGLVLDILDELMTVGLGHDLHCMTS